MNSELIEKIYKRINHCKKKIKELSYDDACRRTNADKIDYYQGKIDELKWVVRELIKEEDAE